MSALHPEYQKYAARQGQHPVPPAAVELYGERPAVKWVPSADNPAVMVPVLAQYVQPMLPPAPRDLTPRPLIDAQAQRFLGAGVGIGAAGAGLGYGAGQMFAGVAMMGTSGLAILLGLLLAAGARGRTVVHERHETHVTQKWFGRADVTRHG